MFTHGSIVSVCCSDFCVSVVHLLTLSKLLIQWNLSIHVLGTTGTAEIVFFHRSTHNT